MSDFQFQTMESAKSGRKIKKPRLGFLGVGWIGLNRMEAIAKSGLAEITSVCDLAQNSLMSASEIVPSSEMMSDADEFFSMDMDAVVIATPNAFHAAQAIRALNRGMAVFCQKPLGCSGEETARVVAAAEKADKLVDVDFSYRFTHFRIIRDLLQSGDLGEIYAADLMFHNAYGPDKSWYYDPRLSGGGCVLDLGIHLIDLALWSLDFPQIISVKSDLFSGGKRIEDRGKQPEDFAAAQLTTDSGTAIQLACSWNSSAGNDAVIEAVFYGTRGGAFFRNIGGSFYRFQAMQFKGRKRKVLESSPDNWGGRAALNWLNKLAAGSGFDREARQYVQTSRVIDQIYCNETKH